MQRTFLILFVIFLSSCNSKTVSNLAPPELSDADKQLITTIRNLPNPPKEYEWKIYKGLAFLKPIFWYEYKNNKKYISSPVPLTPDVNYKTGISIRYIPNIKSQNSIEAEDAALKIINIINRMETTTKLVFTKDFTKPIKLLHYRYQDNTDPSAPYIKHMHFLINNKKSYIIIFDYKNTIKDWDYSWKNRAALIFNNLTPVDIF